MEEEYFGRILRLKPIIEADEGLLSKIKAAFKAVYDEMDSLYGPVFLPDVLQELGKSTTHIVIGLRQVITDPANNHDIHLALKLKLRDPYSAESDSDLEEQLGAYEFAFMNGDNPPYFVGVVTAEASYYNRPRERLAGIITEDVSKGKTLKLLENTDENFCRIVLPDGSENRIFIDPTFGAYSVGGEKYLTERARIDLK